MSGSVSFARGIIVVAFLGSSLAFGAKPSLSKVFPEGDQMVFTKLSKSYQKEDLNDVIQQTEILRKKYPRSLYTDQAVYLRGYLSLKKGRFAEALKDFSELESKRPLSVKRREALFAKAMTYKKLNLPKQADSVLSRLQKNYPGSPESRRATLERRLLRVK
ncbi:MAG: hypothetical protein CL676_13320 [Bdellovibrionaceae bacterium]|nr:hypothetical protein [Pseudobdellovibrionaceae bacterium]|tara:strand:+ start:3327 stop:3809 length:483 start_codon:yes stop_codon:yes gene_type:complete